MKRWDNFLIVIDRSGGVTLRRPSGRTIAWHYFTEDPVGAAKEWQFTYPGSIIVDRRKGGRP